jgi:4a-hydroxytetrahydrobiopterin dehydratase
MCGVKKPVILKPKEIKAELKNLPGWKFADNKISKQFEFKDFVDSIGFVNKLVPFFESVDHHPDTHILYSKVLFELQRFDIGGKVTDKDILVATKIEKEYTKR